MPLSPLLHLYQQVTKISCFLVLIACLIGIGQPNAQAATGPFAGFPGRWSGTGVIRQNGNPAERIRCTANYRVRGGAAQSVDLQLSCASDNYNFDLSGSFETDASNQISGRWSERTRNIGGTVAGVARGDSIQIHVESSAFAANLIMVTRGRRQSVSLDSQGGGQMVKASIALNR